MSHKPIRFNASSEELLRHEIHELAVKVQSLNDQRDFLIGKSVAIETGGMNYTEQKAFSLGIRWYACKDFENFKKGYREVIGVGGNLDPSNTWGVLSPASNWGKPPTYRQMTEAIGTTDNAPSRCVRSEASTQAGQ